jgi:hypothetical protein
MYGCCSKPTWRADGSEQGKNRDMGEYRGSSALPVGDIFSGITVQTT